MKQESHRLLGHHLLSQLQTQPRRRHTRAFLIGCVQPDRNPLSYLKGSLRARWFYGHNYQNADRWIERHIDRLSAKETWNLWNYYCMGKVIHYTSDAFTYVHNNCFRDTIAAHRAYEEQLQEQFLLRLDAPEGGEVADGGGLNHVFRTAHRTYLEAEANVHRDCQYIFHMTAWLFRRLFPEAAAAC